MALTLKQERFCQLYATDVEFFGNGTQSYIEAYNIPPSGYNSARAEAAKSLSKPSILARITEIMEVTELNDAAVDKHLAFWISQKSNPQAAVTAIKEYNSLKQRITKKIDVQSGGKPLQRHEALLGGDTHVHTDDSDREDT